MNWLKEAFRSQQLDAMSTALSRSIINGIKRQLQRIEYYSSIEKERYFFLHNKLGLQSDQSAQFSEPLDMPNGLDIAVLVEVQKGAFGIRGTMVANRFMKIEITIPFSLQSLHRLMPSLKSTLRHELEHMQQFNDGRTRDSLNRDFAQYKKPQGDDEEVDKFIQYLTSAVELDPMIVGLRRESITSKRPLRKVIEETLEDACMRRFFTPEETMKLKSMVLPLWLDAATKRGYSLDDMSGPKTAQATPTVWWHATTATLGQQIVSDGAIKPSSMVGNAGWNFKEKEGEYGDGVYLARNAKDAMYYADVRLQTERDERVEYAETIDDLYDDDLEYLMLFKVIVQDQTKLMSPGSGSDEVKYNGVIYNKPNNGAWFQWSKFVPRTRDAEKWRMKFEPSESVENELAY